MIEKASFEISVGHGTETGIKAYGDAGYREARLACVSFLKAMMDKFKIQPRLLVQEALRGRLVEEDDKNDGWKDLIGKQFRNLRIQGKQLGVTTQLTFNGDEWRERTEDGSWLHKISGQVTPPPGLAIGVTFDFEGDQGERIKFQVLSGDGDVRSEGLYALPQEPKTSDVEVG